MKTRLLRYGLLFLLAVNIAVIGRLAYTQLWPTQAPAPICAKRAVDLNLNEMQIQQMRALRTDYQAQREIQWTAQAHIQQRLITLLAADPVDTLALDCAVDSLSAIHARLQRLSMSQLIKEKALLDANQKAAFIATLNQCHNKACMDVLGAAGCPVATPGPCPNNKSQQTPTNGGQTP